MTAEQIEESVGKDSISQVLGLVGVVGVLFALFIGMATYASVVNQKEAEIAKLEQSNIGLKNAFVEEVQKTDAIIAELESDHDAQLGKERNAKAVIANETHKLMDSVGDFMIQALKDARKQIHDHSQTVYEMEKNQ